MGLVLSSDCDALLHRFAPIPVWEEQTPYSSSIQLPQWDDAEHPSFTLNEEVMLCPTIFVAMCQNFNVKPKIDLFASARHHQLTRYYSIDRKDPHAEGYNAFNFLWSLDTMLYINYPVGRGDRQDHSGRQPMLARHTSMAREGVVQQAPKAQA